MTVKVIEAHKCCKAYKELSQLLTFVELNVDPVVAVDCRTEMRMLMVLNILAQELTAVGDLNHEIDFVVDVNVAVVVAVENN